MPNDVLDGGRSWQIMTLLAFNCIAQIIKRSDASAPGVEYKVTEFKSKRQKQL